MLSGVAVVVLLVKDELALFHYSSERIRKSTIIKLLPDYG